MQIKALSTISSCYIWYENKNFVSCKYNIFRDAIGEHKCMCSIGGRQHTHTLTNICEWFCT